MPNELDDAIAKEQAKVERLSKDLADAKTRLKTMLEARRVLRGEPVKPKAKPAIVDIAEDLLRKSERPLHMDEIVTGLHRRGVQATKTTITTALARYAAKGRRFRRVAPNTFSLMTDFKQRKK